MAQVEIQFTCKTTGWLRIARLAYRMKWTALLRAIANKPVATFTDGKYKSRLTVKECQ